MVRLGIATGSRGPNGESTGHRGLPPPDQHLYSYPVVRRDEEVHHSQQHISLNPSTSSPLQHRIESRIETTLPPEPRSFPIRARSEALYPAAGDSLGATSCITVSSRSNVSGWPKTARDSEESVIRIQKRPYRESEEPSEAYENKYLKEVKWCPVCRSPVHTGVVHHCHAAVQHGMNLFSRSGSQDKAQDKFSNPGPNSSAHTSSHAESLHHNLTVPEDNLSFSGRISSLRVPLPAANPHSISPSTSHLQTIPQEDHSPSTSNPSVLKITPASPVEHRNPRSPSHSSTSRASTSHHIPTPERPGQSSPSWSGGNYPSSAPPSDAWETPTSLISRLTAGMTARSNAQQEDKDYRGCASPSMSEDSSVSSYYGHQDSLQPDDPFSMAHQELMEDFCSKQAGPSTDIYKQSLKSHSAGKMTVKRTRRYTSSESGSSEVVHGGDSSVYGSQDSDTEDNSCTGYLDENGKLPDLDTLLKCIKQPDFTSYSPDKTSIEDFLDPHEIGHINHLIKSVSDAMLTISLPETLYKSKGFTPLDYMDIHLNCVIRHFFFVFKNEDFLNLGMADQIALLDGCTLRAIQCTSLYLFNKDAGCWHIPGATNKANHPVIHISDLMQVFPQAFVNRTYELHSAAARLGFDWPMGVIASCILMYTPLNRLIQELDKVDVLRNKYVNLLLKYVTWKHGTYNASLLFPEILKLLDALLLHVDDLASITLKLNQDEVIAVEERLATLTLSQMAPYGCQSSKFKEKVASWSTLDCVKLGDIQNKLCMAMHVSMRESLQSNNAHYWTNNTVYYGSSLTKEDQVITHCKTLPQLMPPTEKDFPHDSTLEHSAYFSKKMLHQNREMKNISALAPKDLMMLRKFLEEVTNREGTLVVQNIKEKMDSNQIKKIINKLCS